MVDKMKNNFHLHFHFKKNKKSEVGVLRRPSFLSKGVRLPKKFDLQRNLLAKSVVANHIVPFP